MKYINFKRYKLSTFFKNINLKRYNFSKIRKHINIPRYDFNKIFKLFDFRAYNFSKILKYFDWKRYKPSNIYKLFNFKKIQYALFYVIGFIFLSIFIYLSVPIFFKYDKSRIANLICSDFKLKCSIEGNIKYSFFPSPRIKLDNFTITYSNKKRFLAKIENVAVKLSIFNLFNKKKYNYNRIDLENAEINLDMAKLELYKKIVEKRFNSKNISLKQGNIKLFDDKNKVVFIQNSNLKYKSNNKNVETELKGDLLNDKVYFSYKNKISDPDSPKIIIFKLLDLKLLTEIELFDSKIEKDTINANVLFKQGQNKITGIVDYYNSQIIIKRLNLRNAFLDGKLDGKIEFLPYFSFDLNADLNSINFNRLYNLLINIDEKKKVQLFKLNEKINGKLNMSAEKIFSKYTFINSFESRIRFINGDILFEQLLLNLKKLGAADITGIIKNDGKFTNFKFEKNIYLDNLKSFYNRFGIHNKEKTPYDLFVSGSLDLVNFNLLISEISSEKKFQEEDIKYIEKEFNDIILEEDFASLFNFLSLKEFIRSISLETN